MPPLSPTVRLRAEAAQRLGYTLENLDPETGYLYEVSKGDRKRILLGAFSPHNDAIAARLAEDKFHTATIVRRLGLTVPAVVRCLRPDRFELESFPGHTGREPALAFAETHGYPLIVKPNRGARGRHVTVVHDASEMLATMDLIWQHDYLVLVQELIPGMDVRLDFLRGEYLFGYTRRPVGLSGDGERSLRRLLVDTDPRFTGDDFYGRLAEDPIWTAVMAERGWTLDSVPPAGEALAFESPVLNLNRLCLAELVREIPDAWLEVGRRIGEAMNLGHYGIDFKAPTGLDDDPADATVIEVNASPSVIQMSRRGYYEEALAAELAVLRAALEAE